jgi:hypothetical protein
MAAQLYWNQRRVLLTGVTASCVPEWSKPDGRAVNARHLLGLVFSLLNYYYVFFWRRFRSSVLPWILKRC